ncbi:hypothetical protein NX059_010461 [Plenodomus lindquistii]|nr:hypothetical protein NX059_010461 [Plenodomus lindquistii]
MASTIHQSLPFHTQGALSNITGLDDPESMQWTAPNSLAFHHFDQDASNHAISSPFASGSASYAQYSQNGASSNDNYNLVYSAQYPDSSCPRSYSGIDVSGLPTDLGPSRAYPPEAYQIEPPKHLDNIDLSDQESNSHLMQMNNDYDAHPYTSHIKVEDSTGYQSPYSTMTRASTPQDCSSPYPNGGDTGSDVAIDKEQPYAQLIYQALLHADNHTMILRDIYDWFKKHTDKAAASETKGWQNSIRHNLSMNGAFEKVDQPGEESRKGFMWRLSASALREGVKSTTRYRSKVPNKRAHRSHFPQPQRQASGSKGGQAARRSVRMRRSERMAAAGEYRSVPVGFDPMAGFGGVDNGMGMGGSFGSAAGYVNGEDLDFGYHSHSHSHDKEASMGDYTGSPSLSSRPLGLSNDHLQLFASRPYTGALMPAPSNSHPHLPHGVPHSMHNHGHTSHPHPLALHLSNANTSPTSALAADQGFLFDHSPTDSLFSDPSSPGSVDEPRTPEGGDVSAGGWGEDVALGLGLGEWDGLGGGF